MRVLALDAATEACSVALYDGRELLGRFVEPGRGHAERILGMVEEVLAEAGWRLSALDGIAAGVGPGSFTGVRISVATAQGLAFGAGLEVVAVSSLEALALAAVQAGARQVLACLDARMGQVYWGCFAADPLRGVVAAGPARVTAPVEVCLPAGGAEPHRGIGRGFKAHAQLAGIANVAVAPQGADALPDAREMAQLGAWRLAAGEAVDPAALAPVYLRDNVALTEAQRDAAR